MAAERNEERAGSAAWQGAFNRLWAAQSVALFGQETTTLALPLIAALILGATPFQMGLLVAAGEAPFLLLSLPTGVLVDRSRRWPLLLTADLGRAFLLALIPAAAVWGMLRLELLYVVAFLAGALGVLFEVAHYAYVPSLVPRHDLTTANGRLQVSHSAAEAAGPGLAGLLIQAMSAPLAVLATAATFVMSALLLGTIRRPETHHLNRPVSGSVRTDIVQGLRTVLHHPLLRPIVLISGVIGIFLYAVRALYILFATRDLGLDPLQIGIIMAVGGLASIPGGLLAQRVAGRIGVGTAIWGGWLLQDAAFLLLPLATAATAMPLLIAAQLLGGVAGTVANVNQWSLRQAVTPHHLQGRVTATHRFLVYGAFPLGALLGGALASVIGMREALWIGAIGATLTPLLVLLTPLRALRAIPTEVQTSAA